MWNHDIWIEWYLIIKYKYDDFLNYLVGLSKIKSQQNNLFEASNEICSNGERIKQKSCNNKKKKIFFNVLLFQS